MKKLKWLLNHITKKDKLYHAIGGVILFGIGLFISPATGLILAIAGGAYKEIYDEFIKKTGGDPWDYFATIFFPILIFIIFF